MRLTLIRKDESHLHMNPVFADFIPFDDNLLVLDPRASDVLQGFYGSSDSDLDCVLKAVW